VANWRPLSNQDFQNATCALCGGNIEFPATAGGMTVECPHCGQQTELPPVQKPSRSIWGLLIFAVVGVAAVGVLFFLKSRETKAVATAPAAVMSSNPAPVAAESPRPKSAGDLKLVGSVSIEKAQGSRLSYAMGTLKNDSEHQRYGVKVEVDLFDQAGNRLPTQANDYLQSLEPRKEWKFRALVVDLKAVTAKLAAVKEED
jgi:hypothetical protein